MLKQLGELLNWIAFMMNENLKLAISSVWVISDLPSKVL